MVKLHYAERPDPSRHVISTLSLERLRSVKGDATVFVETGTNVGAGVQTALEAGFERIISFEVIPALHDESAKRFDGNAKVELIFGSSREKLGSTIQDIDQKILFWLDGHEFYDIPLVDELSQIKRLSRNDHVILIDDMRMFGRDGWQEVTRETVIDLVLAINPDYQLTYLDSMMGGSDILVARV